MKKTIFTVILTFLVTVIFFGGIFMIWKSKEDQEILTRQLTHFEEREQIRKEIVVNDEIDSVNSDIDNNVQEAGVIIAKQEVKELPEGSFKKTTGDNFTIVEGDLYISGYFKEIKPIVGLDGNNYEKVNFCVTDYGKETEFTEMLNFGRENFGNAFYFGNNCFSLGCLNYNEFSLSRASQEDLNSILNSSVDELVTLHIEAEVSDVGRGMHDCYSVFNKTIEVYK